MKWRSNKLTGLALAAACFWSAAAVAVPITGMYSATTIVADQGAETREAAMPAMLEQVIGRVVGEPDPEMLRQRWPAVATALGRAEAYLEQFLYQRLAGQSEFLRLRVEFDQIAVDKLIKQLAMPQWGSDRPEVLTVLAWEGDGRREVLGSSPSSLIAADLLAELEQTAQQSGLPIALPLMDLQDQRDLPVAEIRAGFHDQALEVAARYGADAVLVGQLKMAAGGVLAERNANIKWTLLQRNRADQTASYDGVLTEALQSGLWMATRSLAQRYAVAGHSGTVGDSQNLAEPLAVLQVLGIRDFVGLKEVEKHLQSRSVVSSAQLTNMREDNGQILATFQLGLKADVEKLEQALRVGRLLVPTAPVTDADPSLEPEDVDGSQAAALWYRLSR